MTEATLLKTARIRELNDQLRCKGLGGRIVVTRGLDTLGTAAVCQVLAAVAAFVNFTDCAVLTVTGRRIIFKIDYYDLALQYHSPDASDPAVTQRVMTVMLAEEY
jgi:hypothetical protein